MAKTPKTPKNSAEPAKKSKSVKKKAAETFSKKTAKSKNSSSPVIEAARRLPNSRSRSKAKTAAADPIEQSLEERDPHAKRPTPEEEIKILERRYLVWDLYKAGASFRAISEHLKAKGEEHCSVGTVHSDLKWCLNLQHENLELDVRDHIENEVAVLQDVRLAFTPVYKDKNMPLDVRMDAGSMVINTVKEIAKLRNLYKPPKVMLSPDDELAKILGISTDQLPDVD